MAELLRQTLGDHVKTFNQDDFYYDENYEGHTLVPELNHTINWDIESAFNNKELLDNIIQADKKFDKQNNSPAISSTVQALESWSPKHFLLNNKEVSLKTKDLFKTGGFDCLPIQIVEGITIFDSKLLTEVCDLKIFVTLDYQTCVQRRNSRIYPGSWTDPPGYFDKIVWPSYLDQLKTFQTKENIHFIDGCNPQCDSFVKTLKLVVDCINKHFQ